MYSSARARTIDNLQPFLDLTQARWFNIGEMPPEIGFPLREQRDEFELVSELEVFAVARNFADFLRKKTGRVYTPRDVSGQTSTQYLIEPQKANKNGINDSIFPDPNYRVYSRMYADSKSMISIESLHDTPTHEKMLNDFLLGLRGTQR